MAASRVGAKRVIIISVLATAFAVIAEKVGIIDWVAGKV